MSKMLNCNYVLVFLKFQEVMMIQTNQIIKKYAACWEMIGEDWTTEKEKKRMGRWREWKCYTMNILSSSQTSASPVLWHSLKAVLLFLPISVISIASAEREWINWGRWEWTRDTEKEHDRHRQPTCVQLHYYQTPKRRTLHYQEDCWQLQSW